MQEDVGLRSATDGEFRRASWHMDFIYQLGGITKAQDNIRVQFRNEEGTIEFTPAALRVDERVGLARADLRRGLRLPAVDRGRRNAEADDPLAEHGPLPRRPRGHRPRASTPTSRRSGATSRAPTPTRSARWASPGCTYLQFDDTSLAYLNDPAQREHIASLGGDGEHQHEAYIRHINEALAGSPEGHDGDHAHVPRQLPLVVGGRGRLRLRRRGAVRRARRSTASSWSGTTRARAASSRCASCRRARSSCSGWSPPSAASSRRRTSSSAASRRPRSTSTSTSCACRRSAASRRPSRATRSGYEQEVAKLRLIVETADEVWG